MPRHRAPPSHLNVEPKTWCPVGSLTDGSVPLELLGLCGPSELRNLGRKRKQLKEVEKQGHKVPSGRSLEEALRLKLRCLDQKLGCAMLKAHVGRQDVAQHILSFLQADRPLVDTEVGGKMFVDSGSANVDLFFHSLPQGAPCKNGRLEGRLEKAWLENPEVCLKQIFLIGSREGKQDRYAFYDAMVWLWQKDPATLLANLHHVPECNYWKALLELLARICEGPQRSQERDTALFGHFTRCKDQRCRAPRELKIRMSDAKVPGAYPAAISWCPGSRLELAETALRRYDADPLYRSLFQRVGQLFAEQLKEDLRKMERGERISLCAKWCPWLQHSFDRRTLICESIARWLFPPSCFPPLTERHYAFRARDRLRKVLGQLKEYMKCTERLMCQNRWGEIRYRKVHAICLGRNAHIFEKKDPVRFQRFVNQLAQRKSKVNVGSLQPHQLLSPALRSTSALERVLVHAQWRALVSKVRDTAGGSLSNCVAVCDVSASMTDAAAPRVSCMDVAIALSLLVAQAAEGPWAGQVITFSRDPRLVKLPQTESLVELYQFVKGLDWGGSTNFHKIFDLLKSEPPKQIWVFSDMHFAAAGGDDTVLRKVQKEYKKLKLELPELVFWNLAAQNHGAPALANDSGVVLMSGFSAQMIANIMDPENSQEDVEGKKIAKSSKAKQKRDPIAAMCTALRKPFLQKLRVVYDHQEAVDLYQTPVRPLQCFHPEPPGSQMVETYQKAPLNVVELPLVAVPRSAMATMLAHLNSLRCRARRQIQEELGKVKFRFRLELLPHQLRGTLRSRWPEQSLVKVVGKTQRLLDLEIKRVGRRRTRSISSRSAKKLKSSTTSRGMKRSRQ